MSPTPPQRLEYPLYKLCLEALDSIAPNAAARECRILFSARDGAVPLRSPSRGIATPDLASGHYSTQNCSSNWAASTGRVPFSCLRDYHAQNVVYRPEQSGLAQIGLLDFQDAQLGHPLYDAASLIHDARRSLDPNVEQRLKNALAQTYAGADEFHHALSTLSAQRNLRVLALFARLCLRDGKPRYLKLMPHVWNNLWRDLSHPHLSNLFRLCRSLPEPTPNLQSELRAKCASRPMS